MDTSEDTLNPPAKRPRVEVESEASGASRPQFQKDSSMWIEDGNVVIVCGSEPDAVGFRFYKGLLSQKCEVFRDMFSVCDATQPEMGTEMYEGCPMVVVHDEPGDFRYLLKYILDRDFAKDLNTLRSTELAILLRMASKYSLASLRLEIIEHLKTLYPPTLDEFRSSIEQRKQLLPTNSAGVIGVLIGHECDVPAILPVAFYLCSLDNTVVDGVADENTALPIKLPPQQTEAYIRFIRNLSCERAVNGVASVSLFDWSCRREKCRGRLPGHMSRQNIQQQNVLFEIFHSAPQMQAAQQNEICEDCFSRLRQREEFFRERVWEALPGCCGLGSWEKLRDVE